MDTLTLVEAMQLIRINEAAMATQFQTWLTITFATIVAVFAGRHLLTRSMKWLVTMLYLLASISITAMSIYLAESNAQITTALGNKGTELAAPIFGGIAFFTLVLVGVATTIYFIHMNAGKTEETT